MNNLLEYKGYYGTVEFSAADGVLHGSVIGIRGLISYEGDSIQSLRADFEDAIDDYLESCTAEGIAPQKPYKGSFNVRVTPELHRALAILAQSRNQSLNATVEAALREYVAHA